MSSNLFEEARSRLFFDPDEHPESTLKAFQEFVQRFNLRYDALYPDPPKVSLEAAVERWKIREATQENPSPKPTLEQFDELCEQTKSRDKIAKFLGMYSSTRLYTDWCTAVPEEKARKSATWDIFVKTLSVLYKPTENVTLKHFHFRSIIQKEGETFIAFCNRVLLEAKHCSFKCDSAECSAEDTAIRDQIIIGMKNNNIRQESLKRSWDLKTLRQEGMKIESAERGGAEIHGEDVYKMGPYSFQGLKNRKYGHDKVEEDKSNIKTTTTCYNCGNKANNIKKHKTVCPARSSKCFKCQRMGHFGKLCKSTKDVKKLDEENEEEDSEKIYNVNLFRVTTQNMFKGQSNSDFKIEVIVNNALGTVIADTGAKVSVCSLQQAKKWNIQNKMFASNIKLKPFNSKPIKVEGQAICAVTFGSNSVPVKWYIIADDCEPILAGNSAIALGIITLNRKEGIIAPINMIHTDSNGKIQSCLAEYAHNFQGIGRLKNHEIKLHVNPDIKPVATPPRSIPYHLKEQATKVLQEMISNDIIEEHPINEPAPWVSNAVIAPKPDGGIRMTLDARNVNKAILQTNHPIPRHEDIKAKLAGCKIFSKLDFKSAFWQIELHESSRYLTVFHANDKLYRYKCLTMGIKPAQGELNVALKPLFSNIKNVYLIHDDLVIATKVMTEHIQAIQEVMKAISEAGLTLNPKKCTFASSEIHFWGMIFSAEGMRPDPAKVDALNFITPPTNKENLISFLCMMQSNSDFIENFAQKAAPLRELTKKNVHFKWETKHQKCFEKLVENFKKETLLRYFDIKQNIFVITDAHVTGFGAILAQGDDLSSAKPVVIASRTTSNAEKRYPQLDLEATAVDFALRRFRNYLVGAKEVKIVTDHKPLCPIFNTHRQGSIRTERIKLRHQDINYSVLYQQGKKNQSDYLSRHGKPFSKLPEKQQIEADELQNLLYCLHVTPIIDQLGISSIAKQTEEDPTLSELLLIVKSGKTWIPKTASKDLQKFQPILNEITLSGNNILLKSDRIILPEKLQETAIQLAHRGSHPGISSMERRLRSHFFFHNMQSKVMKFVNTCIHCKMFVDKKTSEPIEYHKTPSRNWETVAVDLFGPMPSSNHVIVVQDLSSRYPAAKLVSSTKAEKVIPALKDIYNNYGRPEIQISDNGPPFNSKAMTEFANENQIHLRKIPPLHPSSNPAETFMKPLGKTMKIAHATKTSEKNALEQLLDNYRDTPHPATGLSPSSMLFRDNKKTIFPREAVTEKDIEIAKNRDKQQKKERTEKLNSSKYRKGDVIELADTVLIRNYKRLRKFDPIYSDQLYTVIETNENFITVQNNTDGGILKRHRDDLKKFMSESTKINSDNIDNIEYKNCQKYRENYEDFARQIYSENNSSDKTFFFQENDSNRNDDQSRDTPIEDITRSIENLHLNPLPELRRSERTRKLNTRYYNDDVITDFSK